MPGISLLHEVSVIEMLAGCDQSNVKELKKTS